MFNDGRRQREHACVLHKAFTSPNSGNQQHTFIPYMLCNIALRWWVNWVQIGGASSAKAPENSQNCASVWSENPGSPGSPPGWPPRWPGLGPDPLSLSQHKTASQAHYRGTGCCLPLPRVAVSGAEGRPAQHIIAVSDAIERSRHAQ